MTTTNTLGDTFAYTAPVRAALREGAAIVALETTVISHGLPWPRNLEVARAMAGAVAAAGAVPAFIALTDGRIRIGLEDEEVERFARKVEGAGEQDVVTKVSRRDIAAVLARRGAGATTVAGTLACAARAGLKVFATGGIGGVHPALDGGHSHDVSADLMELSRSSMAVVCSGAKSILDLPATVEVLETLGVPVVGYGTRVFPAFFTRDSGIELNAQVDDPNSAARLLSHQLSLGLGGVLVANPVPAEHALGRTEHDAWLREANARARAAGVAGFALTPYLLDAMNGLSDGRTLVANEALLIDNARVAGEIAMALALMA